MNVLQYTIEYFQNEHADINVMTEQYTAFILSKQSSLLTFTCEKENYEN